MNMNLFWNMFCRWVVVVPTGSRNPTKPLKLELVLYDSIQVLKNYPLVS